MRVKYTALYAAPLVQDDTWTITECDHGKTWNCGQCLWIEHSQLHEELFERSALQVGIPVED